MKAMKNALRLALLSLASIQRKAATIMIPVPKKKTSPMYNDVKLWRIAKKPRILAPVPIDTQQQHFLTAIVCLISCE